MSLYNLNTFIVQTTDKLDFHTTLNMLFAVHLKHSSFWSFAHVKVMSNDLVQTM